MDNLLVQAVEQIFTGHSERSREPVTPAPDLPSQVRLGKPGEAVRAVRARLAELKAEDQKELQEKLKAVKAEIKAEKEVAAAGDFNLKAEMEKGTSREELSQKRAAAEIAFEIVAIRESEAEQIQDEIDRISRTWNTKSTSTMNSIQNIQANYMGYLQVFCGGDKSGLRLHADKQERAYKNLLTTEESMRKLLKDEQLVTDVMAEITTFEIPSSYQELLWDFLTERSQAQLEGYEPTKLTSREQ